MDQPGAVAHCSDSFLFGYFYLQLRPVYHHFTQRFPAHRDHESVEMRKLPNIFQYAKAMGYQTHFFDGQKETDWLGTSYDKAYVDDWRLASSFSSTNSYERDAIIAKQIREITETSKGNFIWVIKLGV